eukprot:CAMPEP_0185728704 /NCGR_PEP_ID=MMETSP1171-20130828/4067_1 /TAXON_ID=374046 /ORGANISM="Helicotheca tamensis, Strain CCMP826" /LENGTH=233 /DNA_ID=CAMNT_0028397441 /DNA_START=70 /DNA_END=771 /DNA_ORIENTATION=+
MVNTRRKISNTGRDDLQLPLASADDKERRDPMSKAKQSVVSKLSGAHNLSGNFITGLIILVVLLDVYWYVTPHETKVAHMQSLNDQMSSYAASINKQKADMKEAADGVINRIDEDKKSLADYLLPIVGRSEHEAEVNTLKADYEKLSKEKQEVVEKMQEQIQKNEELLEKLKKAESVIGPDISKFCETCPFSYYNLSTKCGKRKDYLVQTYGNDEESAMKAVMTWDSGCIKDE